jgi:hypothetical protein
MKTPRSPIWVSTRISPTPRAGVLAKRWRRWSEPPAFVPDGTKSFLDLLCRLGVDKNRAVEAQRVAVR